MTHPVIDAHQHAWDPARANYDWLGPDYAPINRAMRFEDLADDLLASGVTHTVQVQSADNAEDTHLMLESAAAHPEIVGIVGFAPLDHPDQLGSTLECWRGDSLMVGVRALIHNHPDPDFLLKAEVAESLDLIAAEGLTFDVVAVLPRHLEIVPILAGRHPGLRLVIDHLAKPPIGQSDGSPWWELIARAAEPPTVYGKVSGLYESASRLSAPTTEVIRPFFDRAVEVFGPERLMYGGDWPISVLAGGYRQIWSGLRPLFDSLDARERQMLLGGTATEFYKLDPRRFAIDE